MMCNVKRISNQPLYKCQEGFLSKGIIVLIVIVSVAAVTTGFITSKSFSSDPGRIGQGKPAAVLLYENGHDVSINLKDGYKKLREKYDNQIEMLIINTLSANGVQFGQTSDATAGTIIFYNSKGEEIAQLSGPKKIEDLEKSFKQAFGL